MKEDHEQPLISLCLFGYNQEKFIREAVEGAFSQTYNPLEIILSDDGSSDKTYEIMSNMAADYKGPHKIVLNRNSVNNGFVSHVNKVVAGLTHGDLIVVAAGDDISLSGRVASIWNAWAKEKRYYVITSGFVQIDEQGRVLNKTSIQSETVISDKRKLMASVKREYIPYLMGCTVCFHRKVFSQFGPLVIRNIEDGAIVARGGLLSGILVLPDILVKYRTHANSATASSNSKAALVKFARLRQQTYLQTLVDINKTKSSVLTATSEYTRLEIRIKYLSLLQDFLVWYFELPLLPRVLTTPLMLLLFPSNVIKETLAASFPKVYSFYRGFK